MSSQQSSVTPDGPVNEQLLVDTSNALRDELVSTLAYMLGNRDDALEAAQESFLKCWKTRTSLSEVLNLRAWIFRIATNTARDMLRSAWNRRVKPMVGEELMLIAGNPMPSDILEEKESMDRLRLAIVELREEEKEVFLLRLNGQLTYEQIAEMRETPVGTVKTQMRAALAKLRKQMEPDEPSPAH